jgi:hypothetical protein
VPTIAPRSTPSSPATPPDAHIRDDDGVAFYPPGSQRVGVGRTVPVARASRHLFQRVPNPGCPLPDPRTTHRRAIGTAILVTVLWSSSWILIRVGLADEDLAPLTFAGLRYALAAVALLIWTGWRVGSRTELTHLDGRTPRSCDQQLGRASLAERRGTVRCGSRASGETRRRRRGDRRRGRRRRRS